MKKRTKRWYKQREDHCIAQLWHKLGIYQYDYLTRDHYERCDGKAFVRGSWLFYSANVRNDPIETYDTHIIERWTIEGLYKHIKEGLLWYIQFFPASDRDRFDCILYNISPRLRTWEEQGNIHYKISEFNTVTAISTTVKSEKEYKDLKFDIELDYKVLNILVEGFR